MMNDEDDEEMTEAVEEQIDTIINAPDGIRVSDAFRDFIHSEAIGSALLLLCAIVALVWANSPWAATYFELLHLHIGFNVGTVHFELTLHEWVNDALMAFFFLVVGLEIKREIVVGELSSRKKAILPVTAALGGMLFPAALFLLFNAGGEGASGWGIPMATDIAFALGILALLGSRVPIGLKVFVTALAIADDLGAIAVLAIFYTDQIILLDIILSLAFLVLIFVAVRRYVTRVELYAVLMFGVWFTMLLSGIHATVAGILIAMLIPVKPRIDPEEFMSIAYSRLNKLRGQGVTTDSLIHDHEQLETVMELHEAARQMRPPGLVIEHYLHPIVVFFILPLFALTNAGVPINDGIFQTMASPVALGVLIGLVVGKQVGVTLFSWLAIRTGYADLPEGVTWAHLYGASWLTGVGFTMSLFITELAFDSEVLVNQAKVGILLASVVAGVGGYLILRKVLPTASVIGNR